MPNNRNIKTIAWARVTKHFKAAFLVSLVPMILTVLSVMSNHNRTTNFTDDRMLDNSDYTNVTHEINHFLQDNWPTILLVSLVIAAFLLVISAVMSAVATFFTESSVSGFIDWHETNVTPEHPIKAGFQLLTSMNFKIALLRAIYTILWSLLFIVPGIIKSLSYSQAIYLYRDDLRHGREIKTANTYISESRKMMYGFKGQLFIMYLSLIGWYFVTLITFGLANIFVLPYTLAIRAEFYIALRELLPPTEQNTVL